MRDIKRCCKEKDLILRYRKFEINKINNFIANRKYNAEILKENYYHVKKTIKKTKKTIKK